MVSVLRAIFKHLVLFLILGLIYYGIEVWFRGYSYWQMVVVAMIITFLIDSLNEYVPWSMPLYQQVGLATIFSISIEFFSGLLFRSLGWILWDYSNMAFNILGVIQLYFCLAWIPLSALAIFLSDLLRYLLMDEDFPHYKIF